MKGGTCCNYEITNGCDARVLTPNQIAYTQLTFNAGIIANGQLAGVNVKYTYHALKHMDEFNVKCYDRNAFKRKLIRMIPRMNVVQITHPALTIDQASVINRDFMINANPLLSYMGVVVYFNVSYRILFRKTANEIIIYAIARGEINGNKTYNKLEHPFDVSEDDKLNARVEEAERIALEHIELERIELERIEAEHIELERIEAERIALEHIELERIELERIETERIANAIKEEVSADFKRTKQERKQLKRITAAKIEEDTMKQERMKRDLRKRHHEQILELDYNSKIKSIITKIIKDFTPPNALYRLTPEYNQLNAQILQMKSSIHAMRAKFTQDSATLRNMRIALMSESDEMGLRQDQNNTDIHAYNEQYDAFRLSRSVVDGARLTDEAERLKNVAAQLKAQSKDLLIRDAQLKTEVAIHDTRMTKYETIDTKHNNSIDTLNGMIRMDAATEKTHHDWQLNSPRALNEVYVDRIKIHAIQLTEILRLLQTPDDDIIAFITRERDRTRAEFDVLLDSGLQVLGRGISSLSARRLASNIDIIFNGKLFNNIFEIPISLYDDATGKGNKRTRKGNKRTRKGNKRKRTRNSKITNVYNFRG